VKDHAGTGKLIEIHFYAPLDEANPKFDINFNYSSLREDLDLVDSEQWEEFAIK
jgi:hypothetical protein